MSKRQLPLPTIVLLRTTLTRTIKLHYFILYICNPTVSSNSWLQSNTCNWTFEAANHSKSIQLIHHHRNDYNDHSNNHLSKEKLRNFQMEEFSIRRCVHWRYLFWIYLFFRKLRWLLLVGYRIYCPIPSVIILVIHKSDSRFALVRFVNYLYDYRPNWTPLGYYHYL